MARHITDYTLYRWRYSIGYAAIGILIAGLFIIAGLFVPGGITDGERASVVTSSMLSIKSFEPSTMINLPYHLLQRISIDLLGVSTLSIKLPSLILGALTTFGILVLLKTWFRRNVAVITTILVLTTGQLLFIAQDGTPGILPIFWSVWMLVAATMVSRDAKATTFWKILFFATAALSLYTPLSAYILLALGVAVVLHPHLRYIIRNLSRPKLLLAFFCALIVIAPLIYAAIKQPTIITQLLGIPAAMPNIFANLKELLHKYLDFVSPNSSAIMTPVYGLGAIALILLGVFRLATAAHTARSYLIGAWILLLLPVIIINPASTNVSFLPILILMAMGVHTLITNWYSLFPRNPYARVAGLVPLAVLIGGMAYTGMDRYIYSYTYDPNTATSFSQDLRLVRTLLAAKSTDTTIVVSEPEAAFYRIVAEHSQGVTVATKTIVNKTTVIYSRAAYADTTIKKSGALKTITTDSKSQNSDRFYTYKSTVK